MNMSIDEHLRQVVARIHAAAERVGRDPDDVRLVGVTKTVDRAVVEAAVAAGLRDLGENRVQAAVAKFREPFSEPVALHLIGHLQTNKARDAVALFDMIQSVDRPSLVSALQRRAALIDKVVDVLIQVNVAGEEQKHGCAPDEALSLLRLVAEQPNLRLRGLMTIAPLVDDPEEVRPVFAGLRQLRDELQAEVPGVDLSQLSMGMTNDFEVAIEEGATIVRVGRALFGE